MLVNDHHDILEVLRGYQDIVVNACHGGFGLSHEAQIEYLERSGTPYELRDRESRDSTTRYGRQIFVNGYPWSELGISRDDPVLVTVVKEFGEDANTRLSNLKVVRIPAGVEWIIEEYDGYEWVAEKHRIWKP